MQETTAKAGGKSCIFYYLEYLIGPDVDILPVQI
jgi:hypothetical protein